jgi:hypothetical protein
MSEAVRTMASPAATWAIFVTATCLALFMATVAMFVDLSVAREQRRERRLGIAPEAGDSWAMAAGSEWPRFSEALLAAAGVPRSEAAEIRTGAATADAAGRHDIPAQRTAPAAQQAAAQLAAAYAAQPEAEAPTQPIPAATAEGSRAMRYASGGRHERPGETTAGDAPTMPDLPVQRAPGPDAVQMPAQRTGESDRAERSLAGSGPQDDDEDER